MNDGRSSYERRTVEFFESVAENYRSLYDETTPGGYAFAVRRRRVLELFDQPGGRVLDVGCGPGMVVEPLLAQGCSYHGVDPAVKMIAEAQRCYRSQTNVHFSVGFATRLDYPDAQFDAVLCMGVLERVEEVDQALCEMLRVLKIGGTLIVTLPNRQSLYYLWRNYLIYPIISLMRPLYYELSGGTRGLVIPGHRLYSAKQVVRQLEDKGFRATDVRFCAYPLLLPPLDSWFPRQAVSLMRKTEALSRGGLRHLGAGLIVKARKTDARTR